MDREDGRMNRKSNALKFGMGAGVMIFAIAVLMMVPAAPAPQPAQGRAGTDLVSVYSQTPPMLDGDGSDAAWGGAAPVTVTASGGANFPGGSTEVTMRTVYTNDRLYMLVIWNDSTDSYDRFPWMFDAGMGKWYQKNLENDTKAVANYEDKLAFLWNINDTIAGYNENGCGVTCHFSTPGRDKPLKYTNAGGELGDIWHWKRVRTGPVGQTDDQYLDNDTVAKEAGRKSDPKTGGGYSNNNQTLNFTDDPANSTAVPKYIYPGATGMQAYYVLDTDLDAAAVKVTGVYTNGTLVTASGMLVPDAGSHLPGIIIGKIKGDRGEIDTASAWADGKWTLEIARNLTTGSSKDVQFSDLSKPYYFGIAPFDDSQIAHAMSGLIKMTFAPRMPHVHVMSVTALPASVKQGQPVAVAATLRNSGNIDAVDAEVEFYLDNATAPLGSVMVNVTMGNATDATATFTWNTSGAAAGNHTVRAVVKATGLSGTSGNVLVVVPAPVFMLEELAADKTAVVLDGNLSLTVKVKNTGDLAGTATVTLHDGNTTVATLSIPVAAGGSNTTVYTWKAAGAGNHSFLAKLGGETKNVTVKVLSKASITITALTSSKTSLKDQPKDSTQKVTLTITLGNAGDSAGTVLLVVKEKGKVAFSENITVEGGKSATRTVTWSLKGEGKHTATATITGDGTGSRSVDVKLGYQTPGFEAVVLIAAAAAGILLLGFRRRV
jgi:hypothetical protein